MSLSKPLTLRHLCHLLNNILGLFYHRHIVFLAISLVKNTKYYLPTKSAPQCPRNKPLATTSCAVVVVLWWWCRGGGAVVVVLWWWCRGGGAVVVVLWWWCCGGGAVVVVLWWWCCGGGVMVRVVLWWWCSGGAQALNVLSIYMWYWGGEISLRWVQFDRLASRDLFRWFGGSEFW